MKLSFKDWMTQAWEKPLGADWGTKHEELNRMLNGGWRRQHLTILAGRPSSGKTTFAVDTGVHLSKQGIKVGMFSIERPGVEIVIKACTNYSGGDPKPTGLRSVLGRLPFWIDDRGAGITARQIRLAVEEDPVDFLIIDYLQLMSHERDWPNRNAELDQVLQELQSLHKDYKLQMLLLSQLSRGVEFRRNEDQHARPMLSDLRDSGAIEQTADEVLFLHREDMYRDFARGDGETEIIVAKNRLGPTGMVKVTFIPEEEAFV